MNTKIKELVDKVGMDTGGKWMRIDNVELFAQLIVRECIKAYNDDGYQTDYEQDLKVLQHFGIEE
jgi:hypothetical protein